MTRKHYEAIARIIRDAEASQFKTKAGTLAYVTLALADMLAQDNPRFDRTRFFEACGREG